MIALYHGTSLVSRLIRYANWSPISHAAWIDPLDHSCWEAWGGRVRHAASFSTHHTPGTRVDLYGLQEESTWQTAAIRDFMRAQEGKRYDLRGVIRFVARRRNAMQNQEAWFCSELIFAAYRSAGIHLLRRIEPHKVYPGMLAYSPLLYYRDMLFCGDQDLPSLRVPDPQPYAAAHTPAENAPQSIAPAARPNPRAAAPRQSAGESGHFAGQWQAACLRAARYARTLVRRTPFFAPQPPAWRTA